MQDEEEKLDGQTGPSPQPTPSAAASVATSISASASSAGSDRTPMMSNPDRGGHGLNTPPNNSSSLARPGAPALHGSSSGASSMSDRDRDRDVDRVAPRMSMSSGNTPPGQTVLQQQQQQQASSSAQADKNGGIGNDTTNTATGQGVKIVKPRPVKGHSPYASPYNSPGAHRPLLAANANHNQASSAMRGAGMPFRRNRCRWPLVL